MKAVYMELQRVGFAHGGFKDGGSAATSNLRKILHTLQCIRCNYFPIHKLIQILLAISTSKKKDVTACKSLPSMILERSYPGLPEQKG